jgi:hypothetical protein
MANPRVRPHLRFYPEEAGSISEYWHAKHWHENVDPDLATPLASINGRSFFVFEPSLLVNGRVVMPYRWFIRGNLIVARAWPLRAFDHGNGVGWIVEEFRTIDVTQDDFLVPFGAWETTHLTTGLPSATRIVGMLSSSTPDPDLCDILLKGSIVEPDGGIVPWTRTDPKVGNRWHTLSAGARVVSFPLWLYCDDVSGNQSKKWNKHYSFLISLAGLPREHFQQEYNVHFLCTSNLAPALEMMDKIVEQLEYVIFFRSPVYL